MKQLNKFLEQVQSKSLLNNYEVRPSPINGKGVFAKQDFKKGDFINTHIYPEGAAERLTNFGRYLNHSWKPNARTKNEGSGFYKTYAEKDIWKDDEITLDYRKNKDLEQPAEDWK